MHRRDFMKLGASLIALPALNAFGFETNNTGAQRLIVMFLRGGMDGMFAFAPVSDPRLSILRPTLSANVVSKGIRLGDTGFSAHPSCQALADLFALKELSFSPCAGTTDTSRSHFQAQDLFELGSGVASGESGFLARAADALGADRGAISFTREIPLCFRGEDIPIEVAPLTGSGLKIPKGKLLDAILLAHKGKNTGEAIEQAIATESEVESAMSMAGMEPTASRGAAGVNGFVKTANNMGRILLGNPRLQLAFLDMGGLDTHAGEEASLSKTLQSLGDGLLVLKQSLGNQEWARTRVVIMSEFGRTAKENGTGGTDHGHGGLFMIVGGAMNGGRMLGEFGGLSDKSLNEKRDLPVTADWRSLLGSTMQSTFGFNESALNQIFPGRPHQHFEV